MRFVIWCAVSSKAQAADDKISLSEQETKCRAVASAKGWVEVGAPYIVPGESRTRHINLRDAENAIPALKQLIQSAQAGQYDLLVMYDYNRLRDLLDPVAKTLANYGVQIYSVSQPVEPLPPEEFSPYASDSESMMRGLSQIISRAQINDLRRKYKYGMPARIQSGLPKGRPPYGYRKPVGRETDRKAVPVSDPSKSRVVVKIRDLFLNGQSLWQIAHQLNEEGILTPAGRKKWSDVNVRLILKNRFYCGEIIFGRTYSTVDSHGKRVSYDSPPSRVITAKGLHTPLWDMKTQRRIDEEFEKRGKKYTGIRRQRLSNLLYCAECGSRCWVEYPGGYSEHRRAWACSVDPQHVRRRDTDLLAALASELINKLKGQSVIIPPVIDNIDSTDKQLADLTARRQRLIDAYEVGSITLAEYTDRVSSIDTQIKYIHTEMTDQMSTQEKRAERLAALNDLKSILDHLPDYLTQAPAPEVNSHLRSILSAIVIGKNEISLHFIA